MDGDLEERLIESRLVFEGRLISVHVDEVARADGTTASREVVRHPGAVAVVPLLPGGRVVMIRQYRHAAGRVLWELPAGTLDAGEAPEKCARRELMEEVGYEARELSLFLSTYLSPGYSTEMIHIFLARDLREVAACAEADERIEAVELPLDEAVGMIERGQVENAAAICGLLGAARLCRGK